MDCLSGCIENYSCGGIIETIDASILTPFVKLFFCEDNNEEPIITVGNESSPQWGNTAVIKSFQLGASDGIGFTVEVIDEQGGSFHLFIDKLNKCIDKTDKNMSMGVVWGWIITNCDGTVGINSTSPVYLIPTDLDIDFSQARIKFTITGTDALQHVFSARHDETEGTDDNKIAIKDAVQMLCENKSPKLYARFVRKERNGTETTYGFRYGGDKGPKSVYSADGQNKMSAIYRWLENFTSDRDKGITARFNASFCGRPTIDFVEDVLLGCDEASGCDNVVGTYIINGSAKSPVISFNPKLNYVAAFSNQTTGGNAGSSESGGGEKQKKKCDVQTEETGITQSGAPTKTGRDIYGPAQNVEKSMEAKAAYVKANSILIGSAIEAELVVQGNISEHFIQPIDSLGKELSLIVINPYHLVATGEGDCGDWLAKPACNDILSNKNWLINGVDHSIKEGSYVTTFKLKLNAPGIDMNANEPFGGPGGCGYVPINAC